MAANGNGGSGVGQENINTDIVTLTRFLTEEQLRVPEATGDFTYVIPQTTQCISTVMREANYQMMQVSSATPCNSPSSQLPTTSDEPASST